jgi:uncharacterized iron-regulated membrane protein
MDFERLKHRPKDMRLRAWIFRVHLWIGITIGLYACFIGTTGSMLMFRGYLERAANRHLLSVEREPGARRLSTDEVVSLVQERSPESRITGITLPQDENASFQVAVQASQPGSRSASPARGQTLYIHPETGALLGASQPGGGFWQWMHVLHGSLQAGRTGRVINGYAGILMVIMCLTGLCIWWPGLPSWKRHLGVNRKAGWKRVVWELHSTAGFWSVLFIFVLSVTGIYYTWPDAYRNFVSKISPLTRNQQPPAVEWDRTARPLPIGSLVTIAEETLPGKKVSRIRLSPGGRQAIQMMLPENSSEESRNVNSIYLNPYTGAVVKKDLLQNWTLGDRLLSWVTPIHFGSFGGVALRILYFVLGLSLPLLFITSYVMWWNRVVRKRFLSSGGVNDRRGEIAASEGEAA